MSGLPECFVMVSFLPFRKDDWAEAGEDEREHSVGFPLIDFCLLSEPPAFPFAGVFLVFQLLWFARSGKSALLRGKIGEKIR